MPDNNGNLRKQEIHIPGHTMRYQEYLYDSLNRLQQVSEAPNGGAAHWKQTFIYDRWGNRTIDTNPLNTFGTGINNKGFEVISANNRLAVPSGQSGVMQYDAAGNLTNDTYTGAGNRTYDAENKITSAWGGNNQAQLYSYDAGGQRIKRTVDGIESWQVYGFGGELLAEYPVNGATEVPQKEYGYRNGELLITAEPRINVALAANGSTASASSQITGNYPASSTINGDRRGLNWNNGGGWNDATVNIHPDWLQIDFNGSKTIDEINVITLQDNPATPAEPTESMTFTLYGLTGYSVEYWNGSAWTTVTGGIVSGNNKVWRKFTFAPITTTKIRVFTSSSPDAYSRITEVEAWGIGTSPPRTNYALGGTTSASSQYSANYPAVSTINGDRRGLNWNNGGGWNDATYNIFSDSLQVDFNGNKTIDEISVFTLQDNPATPAEPTESMTFTLYGLTGYSVEYWNGNAWTTVPGGIVTGNNKVWRKFTFTPITTSKIRVLTNAAVDGYSRVTEIEAYGPTEPSASADLSWLIADHLGTPRMVFDQTGDLANMKRHDYLPFGEELFVGTGGRTTAMGYSGGDGVRQQFTSKERDLETGLDYFLARYRSSIQGRFISADEFTGGPVELFDFSASAAENPTFYADLTQPQSLNKYQYCLNNPLIYVDPDGHQQALTNRLLLETGYYNQTFKDMGAAVDKVLDKASHPLRTADEFRETIQKALGTDRESSVQRSMRWFGSSREQAEQNFDQVDAACDSLMLGGKIAKVGEGGFKLLSKIGDDKSLIKLADEAGASVQKGLDRLTTQISKGNLNPGIGTKHLFGDISYARARDGARVFFRKVGQQVEILGKASKANEQAVIDRLKQLYQP
jgi:RHS repeat-associated protein